MRTGTGTGSDHGTTGGLLLGFRIQGLGVGFASGQSIISCAVALAATMASQVEWFLSVYKLSQFDRKGRGCCSCSPLGWEVFQDTRCSKVTLHMQLSVHADDNSLMYVLHMWCCWLPLPAAAVG